MALEKYICFDCEQVVTEVHLMPDGATWCCIECCGCNGIKT